jgi:hypothetical protein
VFIIPSYTSSCLALAFRCHSQSGPICFVFFGVLFCANSSIHINCWSTPAAWNRILSIFTENSDRLDSFSIPALSLSHRFVFLLYRRLNEDTSSVGLACLILNHFFCFLSLIFFSKGLAKFIYDRIHLILTYAIFCAELHIILYMYNLMSYVICTHSFCTHIVHTHVHVYNGCTRCVCTNIIFLI